MKKIILAGFSAILCAASFLSHAVTPQEFTIPNDDLNIVYTGSWANGSDSAILALPPSHNSYHQGQGTAAGNTGTAYIPISGDNGSTYRPSLSFIATPEGSSNVLVRVHYLDSFGVGQTHDVYVNMYNTGDVRIGLSLGEYNGLQGVEIFDSMPNQCALTSCDIVTFDHLTVVDLTAKDNSSAYQSGQPYTFPNDPIGATIGSYKRITFGENGFEVPARFDTNSPFKLGGTVAVIGDVDGDDVPDLFTKLSGGRAADAVPSHAYAVLFLNSDGTVKKNALHHTSNSKGLAYDLINRVTDISPIGDFDGNGVPDVLLGRNGESIYGTGNIQIVLLNADGSAKGAVPISYKDGKLPYELWNNYGMGTSVTAIGDVDGNGVIDIMTTITNGSSHYFHINGVYHVPQLVLLMETDGTVKDVVQFQHDYSNSAYRDLIYVRYLGDIDSDGNPDFLGNRGNYLAIIKTNGNWGVKSQTNVNLSDDWGIDDSSEIKVIGDVNGDGINDIAIGDDRANNFKGGVYVVCIDSNGNDLSTTYYPLDMPNDEWLGDLGRLSAIGDLDGDGKAELVVGSINYDGSESTNQGAIYILFSQ